MSPPVINPPANIPALKICNENLPQLASRIRIPAYDRAQLQPAIVHIGVGGFNRAHQASYLDDLLHHRMIDGAATAWAECGLGLLPGDKHLGEVLCAQDLLYTLVERSAYGRQARLIGSICDFIHAPSRPEQAIERLASRDCRIVSMTITEGGYLLDPATGKLDAAHPDVIHDLEHPQTPRTFLGYLTEALARRHRAGLAPFTVLSCDNLQGNGHTTQAVLSAFAEVRNPRLRAWIDKQGAFPNSMVDRITPATTEAERALIGERFGIEDGCPVFAETYRQWVIEDSFCNGRPPLELVGVQFTTDVTPFELMKVRLLNGGHFALAYPAALLGFGFVHEVLADSRMRRFIEAFLEAVTPAVPAPPSVDLGTYKASLIDRFSNPNLRDQVERICSEGSAKLPKFILASVVALISKGAPTELLALVVASWLRYLEGKDEAGRPLNIRDAAASRLQALLPSGPDTHLGEPLLQAVLGAELFSHATFVHQVQSAFNGLHTACLVEALDELLARTSAGTA